VRDAGADLNATVAGGWTPLGYAARLGYPDFISILIDAGADVNLANNENETPLHCACMDAYTAQGTTDELCDECALLLIRAGAAVNGRCHLGMTPLDHATRAGRRRLYPVLPRTGASLLLFPQTTDDAYLKKVRAAGGFRIWERNHLNALAATFAPKFPLLPPEMVRRVFEYAFHVGDY